MRSISKAFPQTTFLIVALIGISLLLVACTGDSQPAKSVPPTVSESDSSVSKESPDTPANPTPEPAAKATSSEAVSGAPKATSTTVQAHPTRKPASTYTELQVVTLLPRDAIPAIDNPQFLSADEADEFYDPDELVMGVSFNGDSRAYSVPFLSNHEIVNDTVGGVKIAVTW